MPRKIYDGGEIMKFDFFRVDNNETRDYFLVNVFFFIIWRCIIFVKNRENFAFTIRAVERRDNFVFDRRSKIYFYTIYDINLEFYVNVSDTYEQSVYDTQVDIDVLRDVRTPVLIVSIFSS